MTRKEACLHLGFLIGELHEGFNTEELSEFGMEISEVAPGSDSPTWKVKMSRPLNRLITFSVQPLQKEAWGTDFEVLDENGTEPLEAGYVNYLFTCLTWILEQASETEVSRNDSEGGELSWVN